MEGVSAAAAKAYRFPAHKLHPRRTALPPAVLLEAGSFSPITNMHLRLLEQCRDQCETVEGRFEIVGGFVSPVSDGYGKKGLESAAHRVRMCQAATADSTWVEVDTWEAEQSQWTPTLQVLRHVREELKAVYPGVEVTVIVACGADLLQSFNTPGVWADEDIHAIFSEFAVACLERDDINLARLLLENNIMHANRSRVVVVPQFVPNAISSTIVRLMLRRGMSCKYLVPDAVLAYIASHGLYVDAALEAKRGIFQGKM